MPETHTQEKVRLTGWGSFEELATSIRALLFGEMIKRAIPVVQEYHSDLFHDAHWLDRYVTGEYEFDYLVRTSGTNVGDAARIGVQIGAPGGVFYHVAITQEGGMWFATFTQIPLAEI